MKPYRKVQGIIQWFYLNIEQEKLKAISSSGELEAQMWEGGRRRPSTSLGVACQAAAAAVLGPACQELGHGVERQQTLGVEVCLGLVRAEEVGPALAADLARVAFLVHLCIRDRGNQVPCPDLGVLLCLGSFHGRAGLDHRQCSASAEQGWLSGSTNRPLLEAQGSSLAFPWKPAKSGGLGLSACVPVSRTSAA